MSEFNVKDFILSDEVQEEEVGKAKKRSVEEKFEVVIDSFPDMVIKRKTKTTESFLVLLITQNQFYTKDSKGNVKELTENEFTKFKNSPHHPAWLTHIPLTKKEAEDVLGTLRDAKHRDILAAGAFVLGAPGGYYNHRMLIPYDFTGNWDRAKSLIKYLVSKDVFSTMPNKKKRAFMSQIDDFLAVEKHFGHSAVREFAYEWAVSQFETVPRALPGLFLEGGHTNNNPGYHGIRARALAPAERKPRSFKFSTLIDYLFRESLKQGVDQLDYFVNTYDDYLTLCELLFGKIEDKYPEYLLSKERKLSYLYTQRMDEELSEQFSDRENELNKYVFSNKTYLIRPPKSQEEFIREGSELSHCLSSYTQSYAAGNSQIFFMRLVSAPDTPLITVEMSRDMTYSVQVRGFANRRPSPQEMRFVDDWINNHVQSKREE